MAYSMMSTTNQKRKFVLPSDDDEAHDHYCSIQQKTDDWISLDLDDFIADDEEEEDSFFDDSSSQSSSFISDAASGVPLHGKNNNRENKKRKIMETFVDQELEDTASSPTQSRKVNDFNLFYMKSNKEMESRDICQEIGNTSQQEGTNMSMLESELRKKGLCLIPTSTLLNYLSANII